MVGQTTVDLILVPGQATVNQMLVVGQIIVDQSSPGRPMTRLDFRTGECITALVRKARLAAQMFVVDIRTAIEVRWSWLCEVDQMRSCDRQNVFAILRAISNDALEMSAQEATKEVNKCC
uniref:AAA_12 domain-containing protein n=1 Tax=Ascaris lumbricoides TaxID=6252 RepID=A0A0M3IQM9_ASCLU